MRAQAQIDRVELIEIQAGFIIALELQTAVSHITGLHHHVARQLSLDVQVPLHRVRRNRVAKIALDRTARASKQTGGSTGWGREPLREGIREQVIGGYAVE